MSGEVRYFYLVKFVPSKKRSSRGRKSKGTGGIGDVTAIKAAIKRGSQNPEAAFKNEKPRAAAAKAFNDKGSGYVALYDPAKHGVHVYKGTIHREKTVVERDGKKIVYTKGEPTIKKLKYLPVPTKTEDREKLLKLKGKILHKKAKSHPRYKKSRKSHKSKKSRKSRKSRKGSKRRSHRKGGSRKGSKRRSHRKGSRRSSHRKK